MNRLRTIRRAAALGLCLLATGLAGAERFAIRAGAVYPLTEAQPGPIVDGMVLIEDGRIVAVGRGLDLPPGTSVRHWPDAVIVPGFVSAASYVVGRHTGPHTVGAYRAADSFDTYADYRQHLAWGTTTAHLSPGGHRLVAGSGAVVKLAGPADERVLRPLADVSINLGQFQPPDIIRPPFYASSDVAIEPAERQRPTSRLGQFLELNQRITAGPSDGRLDFHQRGFQQFWEHGLPLRIQARRAADLEGAVRFAAQHKRPAYLVGAAEGDWLRDALATADLPVVLRVEDPYNRPTYEIGATLDPLAARLVTAARLAERVPLALAGRDGEVADLRMVALLARRGGLSAEKALQAITRIPAEILGVADRVGSLAPGRDADLLVLSGPPLDVTTHVLRTYVDGELAYEAEGSDAVVIRAGTIWVGNGEIVRDGSLLVEDGKIRAVGQRVPHPPQARLIDAGADAFVSPGFIDAHGHLGLEGDQGTVAANILLHRIVGRASEEFLRVAGAGVTTVMLSGYRIGGSGSRVTAIKTYGQRPDEMIGKPIAGVRFSMTGKDPLLGTKSIKSLLERGKKYAETWQKYDEELKKWKEDRAAGKQTKKKVEEVADVEAVAIDPITGTWEYTISGGPIPEPVTSTMLLKLTGAQIEGRLLDPQGSGEEAVVTGTLNGKQVEMEIDQETPFGNPKLVATLERDDYMSGALSIGDVLSLEFEATRTDKSDVEFKVKRRKSRNKDGRPTPPKVDENLEPLRPLLAGEIPAVVDATTVGEIIAAVELFVDEYKVPVVLLNASDATDASEQLLERKDKVGVIVETRLRTTRDDRPYVQAVDLGRKGVRIALQSDAEDGARNLPLMGLYAVREGLGGDAALRALTIEAARMFGMQDQVGTLEPGKQADILIHTGHPFDAGSRLERVFVGGNEVPRHER